ncbi:hypothetical protein FJZ31_31485 [Candidatus Poribacteria bacterium]|nr:hypothetical protein [Candidatus Poribacteria bacterium]
MSIDVGDKATQVSKRPMHAPKVLNEAYHYAKPSSFSRGMRVDIGGVTMLFISGTASVNEEGKSVHEGDFFAQAQRTFNNITALLESEGATWHDVVRTTCYLKDMHDYDKFNIARTQFYSEQGLAPLPASTCVEAHLCRDELLVEVEAIALFPSDREQKN